MNDICTLKSQDGHAFTLSVSDANKLETIRLMIQDTGIDASLELKSVNGRELERVIQFICSTHTPSDVESPVMSAWEEDFMLTCQEFISDLLYAAQYLDNKELAVLCCKKIASDLSFNCLGEEEVAAYLGLETLPTKEEEADAYEKHPFMKSTELFYKIKKN